MYYFDISGKNSHPSTTQRRKIWSENISVTNGAYTTTHSQKLSEDRKKSLSWRRILLLIVAITIHNIPGN